MLDDISKFQAENLARLGGFTHKRIAAYVFDTPLNKVKNKQRQAISSFLYRQQISVWTWRNAMSAESQAYFIAAVKPDSKTAKRRMPKRKVA